MKIAYFSLIMSLLLPFFLSSQKVSTLKYLSAIEFNKVLETKEVTLVDVRTAQEFSQGHIPGAINVDVYNPDFVSKVKTIAAGKPLALYCRSGRRSKLAASKLSGLGVEIYELNNGFLEWVQAGFPTSVIIKK